jgi:hypothetical protein
VDAAKRSDYFSGFLKRGIRVFTGIVLFENKRMLHLLRDLGLPEKLRYDRGIEYVEIKLSPQRSDGEG